ncbi:MAG TPA: helicase C-terminal domain-containing protein, partial [Fibrobacteria bacterium]|nr:helicase C-terminal domain-containing protein [Fibrobacteria bacterium]
VAAALDAGGTFAVETPAGVDEHAAGLRAALAAMGRGQRVLLAVPDTAAANALRHILHRDLPAEASRVAILGLPSDYPSRARLSSLAENPARVPPEERAALLPLVAIADRFPGLPVWAGRGFSPDRNRVAWSRARCDGWGDDAAAREARGRAGRADVVIVTHAALCAHVALDGALLPACDVLVATGAHRLPDTALESAGRRVTLFRLRDTLQLMRSSSEHGEGAWADLFPFIADEGREAWKDRWFEPDREFQKFLQKAGRRAEKLRAGGDFRVRYAEHAALAFGADPAPTLDALRANEALLESMASNPEAGNAHRILTRLRDFRKDFEFLCAAHDAGCIYWFEEVANPHKAALRAIPRDMSGFGTAFANLFGGRVFLSPAVLSGADPDAARDARAFLVGAGLLAHADSDESEDAVVEPFEARRIPDDAPQPRFIIASFAPQAGGAEQTEAFARFLSEAAGPHIPKGLLVFCPSQTQLRGLHTALRAVLPQGIPLLAQHIDGNRDAITRLYASERGGWVLATEGLAGLRDADGKAPALWIVSRLPVPPPHDPVLEARGELFRSGREPWRTAAILRVKREWHALRRGGSAPETVWLTDSRAAGEGSGARLARAMGWQAETAKDMEALS